MRGAKKGESRRRGIPNKSTREIRDIIDKNVDFDVVAQKLFELVKGVEVEGRDKSGSVYVLDREPNVLAARTLLEYRFGRPKESVDVTSGGQKIGAVLINIVHNGENAES